MNVYFLVEGQRTEAHVYPSWLSTLLPTFRRVDSPRQASRNCYYLVSANGYPSVIQETLKNAIADVNDAGTYNYLVVCLDADDFTVDERLAEIRSVIADTQRGDEQSWRLDRTELKFVIQNRTIESWFLGNRKIVSNSPQRLTLRKYVAHYDVRTLDPELMKLHPGFEHHAEFHHDYLREVFQERGITYRKRDPGHVKDVTYLNQLLARIEIPSQDLRSFKAFVDFCREVDRQSRL